MMHVAVLLLLLADVVQLQDSETTGSGGVNRTISDEELSKHLKESDADVEAVFNTLMARKQPQGSAAGAGGSAGDGSAAKPAMTNMATETEAGTSAWAAADFLSLFREPAGETSEVVRSGEKWANFFERMNVGGTEDQDFPVQLSESQFQMISQKFDHHKPPKCPGNDGYRTVTGACNNRENPQWGAANRAFSRWLPPQYDNKCWRPQGWNKNKLHNGYPLPEPRVVSNDILRYKPKDEVLDKIYSQMLGLWGQWVTHDMDFSPQAPSECGRTSCENKGNHFPVRIPRNDPSSTNSQRSCMPFVRTAAAPRDKTCFRQQLNGVTSYLDGSNIYGSEECQSKTLRNTTSPEGLLKVNTLVYDHGRAFMPYVNNTENFCLPGVSCARTNNPCPSRNPEKNVSCFVGGDRRVNQNLALIGMNTIFVREHNRLAKELKRRNPHWDAEKVFQEARKIVIAEQQKINHEDYVPILLGDKTKKELPPYNGYKEKENATISNVFTIAFRIPHGQIPTYVYLVNAQYKVEEAIPLIQTLFSTWIAVDGGLDPIFRGMLMNKAKLITQDAILSEQVRDRLFATSNSTPGLDLGAFDMNRGRDHGIPGYNEWRKYCGLSQPRNEKELADVMKNKMLAKKLIELYKITSNIDLWAGAICEPHAKNGRVGEVLACLLGKQFRETRDGDRYWWEKPGVFTEEQRSALRAVTLSGVLCDNTGLKNMPVDAFAANGPKDFKDCKKIKTLDLSPWVEGKKSGAPDHHTTRADL